MRKEHGFTLVEVIILIIVSALLANTIFLTLTNSARKTPQFCNIILPGSPRACAWNILSASVACNGVMAIIPLPVPVQTVPVGCTVPSGFTISVNIACTTINTDANYKTITITVAGNGNATYTSLIASY